MSWIEKKLATAHKMRDLKRITKKIVKEIKDSDVPESITELLDEAEELIELLEKFLKEEVTDILIEEITDNPIFQEIIRKLFDDWKKDL